MIGKRLGHYEILAAIGAGGMGEVYRALDTRLERQVALKILPPQMALDPDRRARFEREAKAVAALRHPHIVTIHSVEEADGYTFLTMELIEGHTLTERMPADGFPLEKFLEFAIPIADAVGHAHARGVAHRDLKPANVMLEHDRIVKVLDFGLAKIMSTASEGPGETVAAANLTGEGRVLGTASYMAPEQAEGKPTDARSDVFSLGVLFYEMITGARPFKGTNEITTITAILRDTPPAVTDLRPSLPRHLGRVIKRCLEKDPERRYESARAVARELETLRDELQSGVSEPSAPASTMAAHAVSPSSWPGDASGSAPPPSRDTRGSAPSSAPGIAPVSQPAAGPATWPGGAGSQPSMPGLAAPKSGWPWMVFGLVVAVISIVAVFLPRWRSSRHEQAPKTPVVAAAKATAAPGTIVVFPFENLGPAEDTYFAAGITDEIMSRLARVHGVSVLSRTTATQYDRKGKTMQQVVADLGVQYVLDGTVRWERLPGGKSRVRVSPQLTRTSDDTQIWANSYDHGMDEIFQVQSEIATEVVSKLGLTLLGSEQAGLTVVPTHNVDAYQAYLRGKEVMDHFELEEAPWRNCIRMLERATELDPSFLQPYAQLAKAYSGLCHFGWERSDAVLAKAKAAADRAVALDSASPWGHMGMAYYYYWGLKEYDQAVAEISIANRLMPNESEFVRMRAFIQRRRGEFDEAAQVLDQAEKLDPRNYELEFTIGETATILRRFARSDEAYDRAIQLAPNSTPAYQGKARNALMAGDLERVHVVLAGAPKNSDPEFLWNVAIMYYHTKQFDRALETSAGLPDFRAAQFSVSCRPLFESAVYNTRGETERARGAAESARRILEAQPEDSNTCSALAIANALLGKKADAEHLAARALTLYPANHDKWILQYRLFDQARVAILTGNSDLALEVLEKLLAEPSDRVSIALLRQSPLFDPLRANPRFKKLVDQPS